MEQDFLASLLISKELFFGEEENTILQKFLQYKSKKEYLALAIQDHNMIPTKIYSEDWIIRYNNNQFFKLFRLEKSTLEKLECEVARKDKNKILQKKYSGGHFPLDLKMQLLIFLWCMGTQDSLKSIGNHFKISHTTVMSVVNKLLYFVMQMKNSFIKFPNGEQELRAVSSGFRKYPGVVGAVDGTHVFLSVEKEQQDSYIDIYRRHSINMMLIWAANRLLTYAFICFPGSAHDSRVFENSTLFREIETHGPNKFFHNENYHLIGDSAFTLRSWLMTPYKDNGNLSRAEKFHNYRLSSEKVIIEHTIGMIKGRWRRLQFIQTYNISKSVEIATVACILHNFCLLHNDVFTEPIPEVRDEEYDAEQGDVRAQGRIKRDRIKNELYLHNA